MEVTHIDWLTISLYSINYSTVILITVVESFIAQAPVSYLDFHSNLMRRQSHKTFLMHDPTYNAGTFVLFVYFQPNLVLVCEEEANPRGATNVAPLYRWTNNCLTLNYYTRLQKSCLWQTAKLIACLSMTKKKMFKTYFLGFYRFFFIQQSSKYIIECQGPVM
jgi:hypothetical protein